jgi:adenine-specific DNA-methyltransferase
MMEKLNGKSKDIVNENIEKLKNIFPEIFTEEKIDFDKLQETLGNYIEDKEERYNFTWNGKSRARRIAQTPSTGTLRPCKEESVDWDNTENLFIEGDNLEVLKLLQKSYHKKVKMIYIDPPYNTGNDFIYKDDYKDNLKNYLEITGQLDEEGKNLSVNPETGGRYHTNWLNMMYPRLKLARNLLKEDGVIFISIDDNEIHNLRKICDEIFGEENFVSQLIWEKKKKGTFLSNTITNIKEYVLVYAKIKKKFNGLIGEINESIETYPCINASNKREIRKIPPGILSKYKEKDYLLPKGSTISVTTMDLFLHSDLVIKNNLLVEELIIEGNWRYNQELMDQYAKNGELYITQDLYLRRIVNEPREKTLKDILPRVGKDKSLIKKEINANNLFMDGWGSNEDGEEELRFLLGKKGIIDFPKPRKLIEKLIISVRENDSIVLDFFAGSCTTSHAVYEANNTDNGNRSFLVVQFPEPCNEKSEAFKAGYKTIADIGKERIRRVIKKIKSEQEEQNKKNKETLFNDNKGENNQKLDLGFKVFKLDSSNIKTWDTSIEDLEQNLLNSVDNIKNERSTEDVLYEVLLKYGLDLTVPIEEINISDKKIYSIGYGALIICLENDIQEEVIKGIIKLKNDLKPEAIRVVFSDSSFKDDSIKMNAIENLKQNGIEDIKSL